MPKMIRISLFIILTLASLLLIVSCGSDKGGAAPRINPIDVVTGNNSTPGSGSNNTLGGGGGGTGACVVTVTGSGAVCYSGIDQTACNNLAGAGTINFSAGQSCQALGYTNCQTIGGVSLCM